MTIGKLAKEMSAFKIGLIRVLTCEDPEVLYAHQKQIMEKFPTLIVETKCIPDQPEGRRQVIASGMQLKEKGAEVIALACTGLATIGAAKELEDATGLPVIDPVMAEGLFAYYESIRR